MSKTVKVLSGGGFVTQETTSEPTPETIPETLTPVETDNIGMVTVDPLEDTRNYTLRRRPTEVAQ